MLDVEEIPILSSDDSEDKPNDALLMRETNCCVCSGSRSERIGSGLDFEYSTAAGEFHADRCVDCGLVFLNPRPDVSEFERIYPDNYHAFEFSEDQFGFVYKVRRRLEANRLLSWCEGIPADARILDIGCGDGFHLEILRDFGLRTWQLEGVDLDERAVTIARAKGIKVINGDVSDERLRPSSYDLIILIQTIEHVADPFLLLSRAFGLLRPGGRLVVVTDNTDSPDFAAFQRRYWGGYHFPRHWNLFNRSNIKKIALKAGFDVEMVRTQISPVNWTYSIRNLLCDRRAPRWLVELFSLKSTLSLSFFTMFDMLFQLVGNGALLNAYFRRPESRDDNEVKHEQDQ
ncbi:MAG: class I SAM-dependent methyltransferase [Pyrinomonadaceae bacterium]